MTNDNQPADDITALMREVCLRCHVVVNEVTQIAATLIRLNEKIGLSEYDLHNERRD